jgi:hypothetical protein
MPYHPSLPRTCFIGLAILLFVYTSNIIDIVSLLKYDFHTSPNFRPTFPSGQHFIVGTLPQFNSQYSRTHVTNTQLKLVRICLGNQLASCVNIILEAINEEVY